MCIRDRILLARDDIVGDLDVIERDMDILDLEAAVGEQVVACLLYTSDAADERSSVDLGGRRIIKKKKSTTIVHPDQSITLTQPLVLYR